MCVRAHTYIHTHTFLYPPPNTHMHTHIAHTCRHAFLYLPKHTHTHYCTHPNTHMYSCTHPNTPTHHPPTPPTHTHTNDAASSTQLVTFPVRTRPRRLFLSSGDKRCFAPSVYVVIANLADMSQILHESSFNMCSRMNECAA